jgi:hypothetical protein
MSADYPNNPHFGRPTAILLCLINRRILIESHASIQAVSIGAVPWVFIFPDINNLMLNPDPYLLTFQTFTHCLYEHHHGLPILCLQCTWMSGAISLKFLLS